MKKKQKDLDKVVWEQMAVNSTRNGGIGWKGHHSTGLFTEYSIGGWIRKLFGSLIALICISYLVYALNLLLTNYPCWHPIISCRNDCFEGSTKRLAMAVLNESSSSSSNALSADPSNSVLRKAIEIIPPSPPLAKPSTATDLKHIVFGIAASARFWEKRKEYIKLWWRPKEMRGFVWLDKPVNSLKSQDSSLPPWRLSGNTSHFKYTNKQGHRSAIRISRIVSETFRMGLPDVHWFVMGDDDTVFIAENLLRVLSKYDHRKFYYIGSLSESHLQNIFFSYNMAYGGGGFAISYPLAKALESMQDRCIQRYPGLYGSDDRMQACMAELGVPLTKEPGFHQYDVYGNLFGLLAAHPLTPLVSLHHLDVVEPIFPNVTRLRALQHLSKAIKLDPAGIMQQSICYDGEREWSFSVSWGYAVQIFRSIFSPRELEMPSRTFLNWYRRADFTAYAFNTRPVTRHPCQKPFIFYMKDVRYDRVSGKIISNHLRQRVKSPECRWRMPSPETIDSIRVVKKPDTLLWQSPRRNCCRVVSYKKSSLDIEVGACQEGEIIGVS
eukprot:Gb_12418 [translate_table: standard]